MNSHILNIVIAVLCMMVGLMILSLSRSLPDESMKRVRIKGLLIPTYWIAKECFGVSFERFVRKWLNVFGIVLMLSSIWYLEFPFIKSLFKKQLQRLLFFHFYETFSAVFTYKRYQ